MFQGQGSSEVKLSRNCRCGTTMILDVYTKTGYIHPFWDVYPVSRGNLHGCTLVALLNRYQLVFKLSFS